jgi:hypothetical protein
MKQYERRVTGAHIDAGVTGHFKANDLLLV